MSQMVRPVLSVKNAIKNVGGNGRLTIGGFAGGQGFPGVQVQQLHFQGGAAQVQSQGKGSTPGVPGFNVSDLPAGVGGTQTGGDGVIGFF